MFARLDHIQLLSPAPQRLAHFYQDVLGMDAEQIEAGAWLCQGPQRRLLIGGKGSRVLGFGAFGCTNSDDLAMLRARLLKQGVSLAPAPSPLFTDEAFSFSDPDGNCIVFGVAGHPKPDDDTLKERPLTARLQHLTIGSRNAGSLMHFYRDTVGFVISDTMRDETEVSACWLRTPNDTEHHSFAIFRAEQDELDHYSYELNDWTGIRDWADHFARKGFKLFWGPGRHGPGNNLFIFVLDPDGNKIELSAELETMDKDRAAGSWRHEPDTLNLWGPSFMRS
ncbi:MAG: VOC family protein [Chloroflexota bacterium]|nr:VOC family protein [Chloroflexota bacterium]